MEENGFKTYLKHKINDLENKVQEKIHNNKRLEAQRMELNN
jgi:hypothetical protein